jgi:hypothetical protein
MGYLMSVSINFIISGDKYYVFLVYSIKSNHQRRFIIQSGERSDPVFDLLIKS